jgi:signal transduction histidine kinase/CHASE3 domain sensor protein
MGTFGRWWDQLRVRQKVWTVVLVLCVPLLAALMIHVTLVRSLLHVQQAHEQTFQARGQIRILQRLAVDVTSAFRGYLLMQQEVFLKPIIEAESRLELTIARVVEQVEHVPGLATDIRGVSARLSELLESKRSLIRQARSGQMSAVMKYVRSGKGIALSDAIHRELQDIEDKLERRLKRLDEEESRLAQQAFWGLLLAVAGGLVLGLLSARVLTRSITGPLTELQASVAKLGEENEPIETIALPIQSSDEIGQLARSYEEMSRRIRRHIREVEIIDAISNEINTIGPDGLDGVLRRITDRAVEMLEVDVCLVMLRNEQMGCWVIEAASGDRHEKLHKTVFLWEEFPVSVRAFETRSSALGEDLHSDLRPEVMRRNLLAGSILSIPLLSRGEPFGVLALLRDRMVPLTTWNIRLADGFAEEAALAIANARLFETAKQKGKDLESRLRHLEHLAEVLAHDMKAPGERMEGLATLLLSKYGRGMDDEATRLLTLIQENGKLLTHRIETILEVARVGAGLDAVEAVDPASVIGDVLKSRAGELEAKNVRVHVARDLPMVPCHHAYLRQIFDNLIGNAVKFSANRPDPEVRVEAKLKEMRVHFSVSDNGCGVPPQHRDRVFEPFVRLNQAAAKGTGIGLTIVKRIVELYGGEVWIEPQGPPGCTVTFTLPVLGELSPARPLSRTTGWASPSGEREHHG